MANELCVISSSGQTWKAIVCVGAEFANGTTLEAYNAAHWTNYGITLSDANNLGRYIGSMPALSANPVRIDYYQQAGGTFAVTDAPALATESNYWDGTQFSTPNANPGGSFTVSIPFVDGSTLALQGVRASILLNGITYPSVPATTGTDGLATFGNMIAGTVGISAYLGGYSYGGATGTITASGTLTAQTMTALVPPTMAAGQCYGTLLLVDHEGNAEAGTVTFGATAPVGNNYAFDSGEFYAASNVYGVIVQTFPTGGVGYHWRRGSGSWIPFTTGLVDGASFNIPSVLGESS